MRTPISHPSEDRLLDHVLGRGDRGLRAMLEVHLEGCEACAARVAELAAPGGRLLAAQAPDPLPGDLWARILVRVAGEAEAPVAMEGLEALPAALKPLLPPPESRSWSSVLKKGVRFLSLLNEAGVELFLLRLDPGAAFPHHAHRGEELALMLQGGAQVDGTTFEAGDWLEFPDGSAHEPQALEDEACWILVRLEGSVRLSGWRGLLQRLVE